MIHNVLFVSCILMFTHPFYGIVTRIIFKIEIWAMVYELGRIKEPPVLA